MLMKRKKLCIGKWSLASAMFLLATTASFSSQADDVVLDDLIVNGSVCVGLDCVLDEEFNFTTLKLKENNLRIFFQDTSSSASFPANDWEIIANDSANGGANFLGFADRLPGYPINSGEGFCDIGDNSGAQCTRDSDCAGICNGGLYDGQACNVSDDVNFGCVGEGGSCEGAGSCVAAGNIVFLMEAGAPANSLKIDSAGFVGLGTEAPAAPLDVEGDAIVRGNLTVTGTIGGGTGADQFCPEKEYVIGIRADGTIICSAKNK